MAHDHPRPHIRLLAAVGAVLAVVLGVLALGASPASAGGGATIDLHNDVAETGTDCPTSTGDYWHFILAPNNGSSSFDAITLNLDGDVMVFSGGQIIPNGSQTDNVFVAVPDGYELDDLDKTGSFANYSGVEPNQFNLSHICVGVPETTTTTQATTTTTTEGTTTTSSVLGSTTISTPGTTGSVPTTAVAPTTAAVQAAEVLGTTQASGQLPYTGMTDGWLFVLGAAVLLGGTALVVLARRRLS